MPLSDDMMKKLINGFFKDLASMTYYGKKYLVPTYFEEITESFITKSFITNHCKNFGLDVNKCLEDWKEFIDQNRICPNSPVVCLKLQFLIIVNKW